MYSRPSLDQYFMQMLDLVASRSTCRRRKVAAILANEKGILISMGYNGVPSGMAHCIEEPCAGARDSSGDNARCMAIHAEQNALLHAGDQIRYAHTLYCSTTPCFNCAKLVVSAGIKRVVAKEVYNDKPGINLLARAGVSIYLYESVASSGGRMMVRPLPQEILDLAAEIV